MEARGRGSRNEVVVVGVHRSLWEGAVSHLQSRGGTFAVESVAEKHASEGDYQMGGGGAVGAVAPPLRKR